MSQPGRGIGADIAGGERLRQRIKEQDANDAYEQWLSKTTNVMRAYFGKLPLKAKELAGKTQPALPSAGVSDADRERLIESGEATVVTDYVDEQRAQSLLGELGIPVSRGNTHQEAVFEDVYRRLLKEEASYHARVVESGLSDVAQLNQGLTEEVARPKNEFSDVARAAQQAAVTPPIAPPPSTPPSILSPEASKPSSSPQEIAANELRSLALAEAQDADQARDVESAAGWRAIATQVADWTVGWDNFTGTARGLIEAYTGRNMFTGEELSNTERAFAAATVLTLGVASQARNIARVLTKAGVNLERAQRIVQALRRGREALPTLGKQLAKAAERVRERLPMSNRTRALRDIENALVKKTEGFKLLEIMEASAANEQKLLNESVGYRQPFAGHTTAFRVRTEKTEMFYRVSETAVQVSGKSGPRGVFLLRSTDMNRLRRSNLSTAEVAEALSQQLGLHYTPAHVTDVSIPAGVELIMGVTREQGASAAEGLARRTSGGGMQFMLTDRIPDQSFINTRSLEEFLEGR